MNPRGIDKIGNSLTSYIDRFIYHFVDSFFRNLGIILTALIFLPLAGVGIELILHNLGFMGYARVIRWIYSFNCHQIPSRCPVILGEPIILCYRCTGFYMGLVGGWVLSKINFAEGLSKYIIPIILIPAALNLFDILGIGLGLWDLSNPIRFFFGMSAGIGPAFLIMKIGIRLSERYGKSY